MSRYSVSPKGIAWKGCEYHTARRFIIPRGAICAPKRCCDANVLGSQCGEIPIWWSNEWYYALPTDC
jgi:hypothetical protein